MYTRPSIPSVANYYLPLALLGRPPGFLGGFLLGGLGLHPVVQLAQLLLEFDLLLPQVGPALLETRDPVVDGQLFGFFLFLFGVGEC